MPSSELWRLARIAVKTAILIPVLLLVLAPLGSPQMVDHEFRQPGLEEAERQKKVIPIDVWDLFYAVKESLDFGVVPQGHPTPSPEENIAKYRRVTLDLLTRFSRSFSVESYGVSGEDYELVVVCQSDPAIRFKATRSTMFVWRGDRWDIVGKYVYL